MIKGLINKLYETNNLSSDELLYILDNLDDESRELLISRANETRMRVYGNKVYVRGLIEFTNYCSRNCAYCGIRGGNKLAERYRLTLEEILECAKIGNELGYKTFVLQGGEDPYFTDEKLVEIIRVLKNKYPDNAITISAGERSYESYKNIYDAGADRYLLRHETANKELYEKFHPGASFENRRKCLLNLKEIGFEVGAGFMVGLPGQTNQDLINDLLFLKELKPHMCGIGPFIPHKDTLLCNEAPGTVDKTVTMLALVRLLIPMVLLPATTALGTIDHMGREKGIKAGANVIMPNLSPNQVRKKYSLYDGKVYTGDEAAEYKNKIEEKINNIGFEIEVTKGHSIDWVRK
ncbi:[FeFe] hydrogenase H-cluster radical SAM maturase HydE [Clostridium sp.]|uniref:[FeFe] hydrogenase H-cluster radical SAM maturase HydE n=1 Tax=Clostridium sp. TaxID=1506 RepID=UPI0032173730